MTTNNDTPHVNRWLVAIMGTILQLTLGTIYAWSAIQKKMMSFGGWNNQEVAWIFSLAICSLGIAAAVGGILLPKIGPRKLAVSGAILYGLGWIIGGLALTSKSLLLIYLGIGVIGGAGLGLGYVTPVATAAKWFPDKKGFVTGMVIMGFGLGAMVFSKVILPVLLSSFTEADVTNWPNVFYFIGIALGVPGAIAGWFLQNPPAGFKPANWNPPAVPQGHSHADDNTDPKACIFSMRFLLMWFIFFCNITAGIIFIGFQSPLIQDLFKVEDPMMTAAALSAAGATLIAISSLFNGIGRFFWGGISDKIGRTQTFRLILGSQIIVFIALLFINNPYVFGVLVCYVLLCYGGGFGTAPSYVMTVFGSKVMGVVYGVMLTAWSMGGLVGPQLAAIVRDSFPGEMAKAASYTFTIGAIILAAGFVISFFLSDKAFESKTAA